MFVLLETLFRCWTTCWRMSGVWFLCAGWLSALRGERQARLPLQSRPMFSSGNNRLVPVLPTYREGIDFVPRFYCLSPALGWREMVLDKGLVFPFFGDIYIPFLWSTISFCSLGCR